MPKAKPTVFDQVRSADATSTEEHRWYAVARVTIVTAAVIILATLFPWGAGDVEDLPYDDALLGTVWTDETVVAERSFPILRPAADIDRDRDSARRSAPIVFRIDSTARNQSGQALRRVIAAIDDSQLSESNLSQHISEAIAALDGSTRRVVTGALREHGPAMIQAAYHLGVPDFDVSQSSSNVQVAVDDLGRETLVETSALLDSSRSYRLLIAREPSMNTVVAALVAGIADDVIIPDLRRDERLTEQSRRRAEAGVPLSLGLVQRGDVILKKGSIITRRDLAALSAYRQARMLSGERGNDVLIIMGSLIHSASIVSILILYLLLLRRASWESVGQLAGITSVVILSAGLAWISMEISFDAPWQFLILVPACSMLISVLFDARTALIVTLVMALAVAGVRSNDYGIALALFLAGSLAAYSTTNLQSRTQLFTSMLAIGTGLLIGIIGVDLERSVPLSIIWPKIAFGVGNAVLSPLVAVAVIIVMEKVFNVATDLRLEEFDNLSHPLLQQLAERAPGTYQHTLAVARLAETAAAAIDANVVLAKVGALFHDIGKLEKAEYFVENQIDIDNKHDRLTPKRSAAIIRQHVQDGIDLARRSGLPDRIIQFIPMHHGTILIKHFYAKALDETLLKESIVDEQDYRYPGPKPTTKEAAIVMLADAAEALSRLVDTTNREAVDDAVQQIITERLRDGQLSMAPLTTADLDRIRESFVKNLIGSTHQRVRYKPIPGEPDGGDETKR